MSTSIQVRVKHERSSRGRSLCKININILVILLTNIRIIHPNLTIFYAQVIYFHQIIEKMKFSVIMLLVTLISSLMFSMVYADCHFNGIIERFRSNDELARMSDDDKRNTVIVEAGKATGMDVRTLQGKSNCELRTFF